MKVKKWAKLSMLLLFAMASGCQQLNDTRSMYIRNRSHDYLKSSTLPPLVIPDDLSSAHLQSLYPLPPSPPPLGSLDKVSVKPPEFGHF